MSQIQSVPYVIFLIFTGAAVLSTLALFTRQSLLAAYIALGVLLGPWGFALVTDSVLIRQTGNVGILFLLFLLGLNLHPQNLLRSLHKTSWVTFLSSCVFFVLGFMVSLAFSLPTIDCLIIGITMMFSSTIIGLKLLPTTILHHQHTGELMISILLLQDLIAIAALLVLQGLSGESFSWTHLTLTMAGFPLLLLMAYAFERFILVRLLLYFDKVREYIFILSIGWCLCIAECATAMGLSAEIGAFIAGVTLASHPISFYIAENLKPLRDFFLVIFFFTIGAELNFYHLSTILLPAALLALLLLIIKPLVFRYLLRRIGEEKALATEVGVRLGQSSEFALLIIYLASTTKLVSAFASNLVQMATVITLIVSCYWVTMRYPTPLAVSDQLRRD